MTDVTINDQTIDVTVQDDAVSLTIEETPVEVTVADGVTDHGALSGLGDDDHTQYLNTSRHGAIGSNPHGVTASDVGALPLSGGTLTGALTLDADPTNALHAATKQYVDAQAGVTNLDDLSDVSVPSPTDAQVLTWVDANAQWEAADAAGGGGASDVDDLTTDTGNATEMLRVASGGGSLEYRTPAQVLADIGAVDVTGDTMTGQLDIGSGSAPPSRLLRVLSTASEQGIVVEAATFPELLFFRGSTQKGVVGVAGNAGGFLPGTTADALVLYSRDGDVQLVDGGDRILTWNGGLTYDSDTRFGLDVTTLDRSQIVMRNNNGGVENRFDLVVTGSNFTTIGEGKLFIHANGGGQSGALFVLDEDGDATFGNFDVGDAQLKIDQKSATGAQPVLLLDQADVSEEMIEFVSTEGVGNAIEAVGAKTLTVTEFIKITVNGNTRYLQVGTIA